MAGSNPGYSRGKYSTFEAGPKRYSPNLTPAHLLSRNSVSQPQYSMASATLAFGCPASGSPAGSSQTPGIQDGRSGNGAPITTSMQYTRLPSAAPPAPSHGGTGVQHYQAGAQQNQAGLIPASSKAAGPIATSSTYARPGSPFGPGRPGPSYGPPMAGSQVQQPGYDGPLTGATPLPVANFIPYQPPIEREKKLTLQELLQQKAAEAKCRNEGCPSHESVKKPLLKPLRTVTPNFLQSSPIFGCDACITLYQEEYAKKDAIWPRTYEADPNLAVRFRYLTLNRSRRLARKARRAAKEEANGL